MTLRACRLERSRHTHRMPRVWKLIAHITPMDGGAPFRQYFLVAIDDRDQAVKALRIHRGLGNAPIENRGEASQVARRLDGSG
jgi:hypothetical protein